MIIQCEQCRTKFRLDDSKVKGKGVKVRCAKCKHVFSVANGEPEEHQPDFGAMLEQSAEAAPQGAVPVSFTLEDDTAAPVSTDFSFDAAAFDAGEKVAPAAAVDTSAFDLGAEQPTAPADFSFDAAAFGAGEKEAPAAAVDTSAFDLGVEQPTAPADFSFDTSTIAEETSNEPAAAVDTSAFEFGTEQTAVSSDFSFDTASLAAEETPHSAAADTASFELPKDEPQAETPAGDFDLSALAWNDELSAQPEAAVGEADKTMVSSSFFPNVEDMTMVQSPAAPVKLDLDDFADSIQACPEGEKAADAGKADQSAEFNINDIDFGDALNIDGSQHVNPEKLSREHELFFAALDEGGDVKPAAADATERKPVEEEMPPLPIASRRKQSPAMIALMAAALLAVAAVLGYFGYSMFMPGEKTKEVQGRININAVSAAYIKNSVAGDMLVVSGDAVNAFDAPRASIQLKVVIYGAAGQPLSTKQAFAGNPLSKEQLATMPVDKIEAAMANQFGDSLANMEVLPGKSIPFMVVITNLPADAKDYGVEVVGSTVSTGKK